DAAPHHPLPAPRKANNDTPARLFPSFGTQPAALSKGPEIFPPPPPAGFDRLGQERPDLPPRRGRAVQAGPQNLRVPPARCRPLCPRDRGERHRATDAGIPWETREQEAITRPETNARPSKQHIRMK